MPIAVALGGTVSSRPLADASASRIVKRYARRVGLEVAAYSGHSLRSGFLTSAAESGASVFKMTEVSRQVKALTRGASICSETTLPRRSCERAQYAPHRYR